MKNETCVKEMVPADTFLLDFSEKIDHTKLHTYLINIDDDERSVTCTKES